METFQRIAEWASELPTLPKAALSLVIVAIAGLALTLLWARPSEAQAVRGRAGLSWAEIQSSPFGVERSFEDLRIQNGVTLVERHREGLRLEKLPNGIYGFCPPWMLNSYPTGVVSGTGLRRITIHRLRVGSNLLEIHKHQSGQIFALACTDESGLSALQDPSRRILWTGVLRLDETDQRSMAISIPVQRIVEWDARPTESCDLVDVILA